MSEEIKTEEVELTEAEKAKAVIQALMDGEDVPAPEVEPVVETPGEPEQTPEEEPAADPDPELKEKPENQDGALEPETKPEEQKEEQPNNAAFARLRHDKKQLEKRLAELEKKPEPQGESVVRAVDKFVKVLVSGEGEEAPLLSSIRKTASAQDLQVVYDKAVAGDYGEHGDDVINMVAREMPMIQNRERQAGAEAKTKQDALIKDYQAEVKLVETDYPDYSDNESAASKAKTMFDKQMLGTLDPETGELDGTGELPEVLANFINSHPYVHHQLANSYYKASLTNSDSAKAEVAVIAKERDSLKTRLAKYEGIEQPSGAQGSNAPKANTAAEAKAKVRSLLGE